MTIKILTSTCIGGPDIRSEIVNELFELYPVLFDEPHLLADFMPPDEPRTIQDIEVLLNMSVVKGELIYFLDTTSHEFRTNSWLVEKVKADEARALVPAASRHNLKVVEIPDGVKWYIYTADDGTESVHEQHRVWS